MEPQKHLSVLPTIVESFLNFKLQISRFPSLDCITKKTYHNTHFGLPRVFGVFSIFQAPKFC